MKILHVASSYWPAFERGGPIQSVHLLNKFLVKNGIKVTVYAAHARSRKEIDLDEVKVFYFPYFGYIHYTFSPALFWALKKNAKKFDLIHITGVWNFPVWAAAFWARFYKKPYIISPRGSLMKEPLEKKSLLIKKIYLLLIAKRYLKNAAVIHFTSEIEKDEYLKAGLPFKKAIIIPNGFDPAEFQSIDLRSQYINFRQKFGIAKDKKIVLFLSRLNWKKGLDTLIPAFAEVVKKEPKAVLVIAGPDEFNYKKTIEGFINKYYLEKLVLFTGIILGQEKIAAFQESDVFVLPSYSENFGMAVVEAMFFGLAVIITKNVGIAPQVEQAGAGLVIEKDEGQLAEAILKILNNPDSAKKMGEWGKKLVESEFSSAAVAKAMSAVYKEMMKIN